MILAILQARVSSTRLPGKVLKPILGKAMLLRQIERIQRSKKISKLIVATSASPDDDAIEELCKNQQISFFRGSLDDVLDRFYQAARLSQPDHVVRLTGDCPLIDPEVIDDVINLHLETKADYTSNTVEPTFPDGLDVEVMTYLALNQAWTEAKTASQREHVTPYIHSSPKIFKIQKFKSPRDLSELRWTVDEPSDFEFVNQIYGRIYDRKPNFTMKDVLSILEKEPELKKLNQHTIRNEGYFMSLQKDALHERYKNSEVLLERALKTIPLGSQTFSKSKTQYPFGVSPYFIKRGLGSKVWDVDGNEYTDFISSLCAINLGYNDPDVTAAVRSQLDDGVIFSLPHTLEMEVAEQIVKMVPCAEMVRFGKNGSDATSGAIRLARAYTKRDHVAVCGYHGWQDWYIGSTARNRGVPLATRDLTHPFMYNDLESLRKVFQMHPDQIAAVILEPMNVISPKEGFLEGVRELTQKMGAVLVFDETITGFRYANGGAQAYFGVTPDLATFGKGMANGYPLSAVAGRAEIMKLMEEIFFSFTFGGETLSLAAAAATLKKLETQPVLERIEKTGKNLIQQLNAVIERNMTTDFLSISGHPSWTFFVIRDTPNCTSWELKTLFLQEMFARGILTLGSHNLSYAHNGKDINQLITAYEEIIPLLSKAVRDNSLKKLLRCKPLEPLFKVR